MEGNWLIGGIEYVDLRSAHDKTSGLWNQRLSIHRIVRSFQVFNILGEETILLDTLH